jgi:hypothetical protein
MVEIKNLSMSSISLDSDDNLHLLSTANGNRLSNASSPRCISGSTTFASNSYISDQLKHLLFEFYKNKQTIEHLKYTRSILYIYL